jgi:hypothetical protein
MPPVITHKRVLGKVTVEATLLDAIVATDNGEWLDVRGLEAWSIQIDGITTATLQIRGSNNPTIPSDSAHGEQLGSDVTVDAIYYTDSPLNWVKVRCSAWTTGTISAYLRGNL